MRIVCTSPSSCPVYPLHPLPLRSVPSGRIGPTRDDVFRSNEEFRTAVTDRELQDVAEVEAKMGRR